MSPSGKKCTVRNLFISPYNDDDRRRNKTVPNCAINKSINVIKHFFSSLPQTDIDEVDAILQRLSKQEQALTKEEQIPADLRTDLPATWITEINDFIGVYVLNLPYIDATSKVAPDSR